MRGNSAQSVDVLLVVPKQDSNSLVLESQFGHLGGNFYIPYYISYLNFCRKLGLEINLTKKQVVRIPTNQDCKILKPNENPSHTALLLATILDHHHFSFFVIDPPLGFPGTARRVLKTQLKLRPKILAISTTFVINPRDINYVMKLARRYSPETKIMVGGQYLLTSRESIHEMNEADVFVIGECEDNLVALVEALIHKDHEAMKGLKGIVFKENGEFIQTPPSPPVDLEKSLPIKWSLMKDFSPSRKEFDGFIMIEDGRGCRFKCSYCTYRKNFSFRLKSVEKVIRELKAVPRQSQDINIFFASSTFTFPQKRAIKIAARIKEENLTFRYGAYARIHDITGELVEKLKSANFLWLFLGVESMDESVLRLARKMTTPGQIEKAVRLSCNAGIITDCSFVVGLPGENRVSVKKIEEFLKKSHSGRYCLFHLVDMDTSDLATRPEAYHFERRDYLNWKHPDMSSQEVPQVMADIVIGANEAGCSYSTFIIDALIGNQMSAAPLTSVSPDETKPFYLLMEKGTVLFLKKLLKGIKIDGKQLKLISTELKQNYLPEARLPVRIKEFIKISVKIAVLKILRFYFLKRKSI
jgi:tRNA A37 methylthiotransferase MiaB